VHSENVATRRITIAFTFDVYGSNAGGDHNAAALDGGAEPVIELPDAIGGHQNSSTRSQRFSSIKVASCSNCCAEIVGVRNATTFSIPLRIAVIAAH
jgi:hypothetical protein